MIDIVANVGKKIIKAWAISFLLRTVLLSILKDCGKLALLFSFPMAFFKIFHVCFVLCLFLVKNSFIIKNSSFALYFIE